MTIRHIGIAVVMSMTLVAAQGFAQQPTRLLRPPPPGGLGWRAGRARRLRPALGGRRRLRQPGQHRDRGPDDEARAEERRRVLLARRAEARRATDAQGSLIVYLVAKS